VVVRLLLGCFNIVVFGCQGVARKLQQCCVCGCQGVARILQQHFVCVCGCQSVARLLKQCVCVVAKMLLGFCKSVCVCVVARVLPACCNSVCVVARMLLGCCNSVVCVVSRVLLRWFVIVCSERGPPFNPCDLLSSGFRFTLLVGIGMIDNI